MPINFVDFDALRSFGYLPSTPPDIQSTYKQYEEIDRDCSVILYISHPWFLPLSSHKNDNNNSSNGNDEYYTILVEGIDRWLFANAPVSEELYILIVSRDRAALLKLSSISKVIVQHCAASSFAVWLLERLQFIPNNCAAISQSIAQRLGIDCAAITLCSKDCAAYA
jgi:hypothetical protein